MPKRKQANNNRQTFAAMIVAVQAVQQNMQIDPLSTPLRALVKAELMEKGGLARIKEATHASTIAIQGYADGRNIGENYTTMIEEGLSGYKFTNVKSVTLTPDEKPISKQDLQQAYEFSMS